MSTSTIISDNGVTSGTTGLKTAGGDDGTLVLQTTTAGGTATTAITIDTNQNVGVGTSSPTAELDVVRSADGSTVEILVANTFYAASSTDEAVAFQGEFYQNDVAARRGAGYIQFTKAGDFSNSANASSNMIFGTRNAGTLAERMRITSGGNLLVGATTTAGTTSPTVVNVVGRLRSTNGQTASIANGATADITLTYPRTMVAYLIMGTGNSAHMSAGFFRSNDNGASSTFTLFGQSETLVAVTSPSAGTIRITNNTGVTVAFNYTFTIIAGL